MTSAAALTVIALVGLTTSQPFGGAAGPARLGPEEAALWGAGLLSADYPAIANAARTSGLHGARRVAQAGLAGPFSLDYGDPQAMLAAARYASTHAEYQRFLATLRRGDVVLVTRNDPRHYITRFTGGPFIHVLLCTDAAPPGRFIEAIGATARRGDPTSDRVRRATAARYAADDATLRIVRPAERLPAERRDAAISGAIAFATRQLGKPYNFAFSDRLGGQRAFYCSSLIHQAYTSAGVDWPLVRQPARGAELVALRRLVLALALDDPVLVSQRLMSFLHRDPAPSREELARYLVDDVLPHARALAPTVATRDQRARLVPAITAAMAARPDGFARLLAACEPQAILPLGRRLGAEALPFADALAALTTGRRSPFTAAAGLGLDALDLLHASGLTAAPRRASRLPDDDFVSPSDLAWAAIPHQDFNVRRGHPLDPPSAIAR